MVSAPYSTVIKPSEMTMAHPSTDTPLSAWYVLSALTSGLLYGLALVGLLWLTQPLVRTVQACQSTPPSQDRSSNPGQIQKETGSSTEVSSHRYLLP